MLQLDHSLENFFKKCHIANDFLKIYFLGSGKGEINFDTQKKKGVQNKNNMIRDLSSFIIQKSNGYEI